MLKGKWKLLICGLLIVCIGFMVSDNVFAAINEGYYENTPVADANLDDKIANSPLLEAIGSCIYAVGSLMEWVLGMVFKAVTGTNMFPWADAILFNAVPFLDVNIFTAADNSLVSILYDFLTGTYYSLLTMASTFFGIAVMVSAVKLAITAIAEDKARYKKAIVDWILGLVMLWGIHFFISFVLYLNEQLVVVASNIVSSSLATAGDEIAALADTTEYNTKLVGNFVNLMEHSKWTLGNWLGAIAYGVAAVLAVAVAIAINVGTFGVGTAIAALVSASLVWYARIHTVKQVANYINNAVEYQKITDRVEEEKKKSVNRDLNKEVEVAGGEKKTTYEIMKEWMFKKSDTLNIIDKNNEVVQSFDYSPVDVCAALLKSDEYVNKYLKDLAEDGSTWTIKKAGSKAQVARLYIDASTICGYINMQDGDNNNSNNYVLGYAYFKEQVETYNSIPIAERVEEGNGKNYDAELHSLYTAYCNIFEQYVVKQKSRTNIIYNLATYFKETAFEVSETGWKANRSVIQNAIMYVLLVSYSLVFFISYAKRLFYVIMLILMAPIVVVFDFFLKSTK